MVAVRRVIHLLDSSVCDGSAVEGSAKSSSILSGNPPASERNILARAAPSSHLDLTRSSGQVGRSHPNLVAVVSLTPKAILVVEDDDGLRNMLESRSSWKASMCAARRMVHKRCGW